MSSTSKKIRLTVDLSTSINDHLEQLVSQTGKPKSELMRLAIDFLLRAQAAKKDDMHIGAWKDDKDNHVRIEREFVGL